MAGYLKCVCADGYRTVGGDCVDVDECAEGRYVCPHDTICINEPGAYSCYCNLGLEGQCCIDTDGDHRGPGCERGDDCAPEDPRLYDLWRVWRDADGDNVTVGPPIEKCLGAEFPEGFRSLPNGTDCDDADATRFRGVEAWVDADGDGYGSGTSTFLCIADTLPAPYITNSLGADCDDSDETVFVPWSGYRDEDGDGYALGGEQTLCIADVVPEGYRASSAGVDCDDRNGNRFVQLPAFLDGDGDGYTSPIQYDLCTDGTLPPGFVAEMVGPDCDDADRLLFLELTGYRDDDLDGAASGPAAVYCTPGVLPMGVIETPNSATDCDDTDDRRFGGATELPDDGIDQNCDGLDLFAMDDVGVYVDVGGCDPSDQRGSRVLPYCEIAPALGAGAGKVFVAQGVYAGPLSVNGGSTALFGGYENASGTWTRNIDAFSTRIEASGGAVLVVDAGTLTVDGIDVRNTETSLASYGIASRGNLEIFRARVESGSASSRVANAAVFSDEGATLRIGDSHLVAGSSGFRSEGLSLLGGPVWIHHSIIESGDVVGSFTSSWAAATAHRFIDIFASRSLFASGNGGVNGAGWALGKGHLVAKECHFEAGHSADGRGILVWQDDSYLQVHRSRVRVPAADSTSVGVDSTSAHWVELVGNVIEMGTAVNDTAGAYVESRAALINNAIIGAQLSAATETHIAALWLASTTRDAEIVLLNNILDPGDDASAVATVCGLFVDGPQVTVEANDLWGMGMDEVACVRDVAVHTYATVVELEDCGWSGCVEAAGNLSADPVFADAERRLASSSPCVDAGVDSGQRLPALGAAVSVDADGVDRPQGSAFDCGAYERAP